MNADTKSSHTEKAEQKVEPKVEQKVEAPPVINAEQEKKPVKLKFVNFHIQVIYSYKTISYFQMKAKKAAGPSALGSKEIPNVVEGSLAVYF